MFKDKLNNQWFLVAAILVLAILIVSLLVIFKPKAERKPVEIKSPHVDVVIARSEWKKIPVSSQGRITASRRVNISAEVNGRIVSVSDHFNDGAYFKKDDVLLKIDSREYQLAVVRADAQVAAAEQNLVRAQAESQQAKNDLSRLSVKSKNKISAYALREPQLKEAQAKLKAAKADYALAQLKLEKTVIRAPFNGRLINKKVELGQYVVAASQLAEIYNDTALQVKLPIRLPQLDLLLGQDKSYKITDQNNITAQLSLMSSNQIHKWTATIIQLAAVVDTNNQLINLLAKINPMQNNTEGGMLLPGMFVQAEISSAIAEKIFVLPRQALHAVNQVWLLNKNNQLNKITVDVLYKNASSIFVNAGINDGQKIIISSINTPIEGMKLESSMELNE